jgi:site-specific DNA-methyltransferase (adenine-specific)
MIEDIIKTGKKYQVIYADPPWSYYNDMSVTPEHVGKNVLINPPYPVLSSKDIKSIPVAEIADEHCLLFVWTTDYHLKKAIEVINSWGFEYKTVGFAWQKLNKKNQPVVSTGGAYTMKSGIELCLLATKGRCPTLVKKRNVRSFLSSQRQHHSKKPDEVRERINDMLKENLNKIELFARDKFDGWDCWGNEVYAD